jgi:hypothetical protein
MAQPAAFQYDDYYRQGDEFLVSKPLQVQTISNSSHTNFASSTYSEPGRLGPGACCEEISCSAHCAAGGLCSDGLLGATGAEGLALASLIGADGTGLDIGGWTEGVYMDNNVPLSQAYNDLLSFDDVPDHFHNGQTWFYMGHAADGSNGLGLGGRVDVVYGTDAQKTQAFGNPNAGVRGFGSWDASLDHGEYGWAIPQAYGEVASGDLSVKVGKFFTPLGYEVVPVTGNFFRSHSYTQYNSEPFTHTGALATYTGYENLTLYGGWALGWDTGFDQLNSGNIAISGFSTDLAEDVTLTYMSTYGNFGWRDGGSDDSYMQSVVLSADMTQRLQYIFQSDYLRTDNPGVSQFDTVGINQYLIYKLNDFVSTGGRVEWWKADGASFNQVTGGFNFHLLSNLIVRPEIRHDWAPGPGIDEDTFLIDAILTF